MDPVAGPKVALPGCAAEPDSCEGIRKNSDGIADEIRKAQRQLDLLLRKARSTLTALNIELDDEALERSSPISLPFESYVAATSALSDLPGASGIG
jgi:hypothetical protein